MNGLLQVPYARSVRPRFVFCVVGRSRACVRAVLCFPWLWAVVMMTPNLMMTMVYHQPGYDDENNVDGDEEDDES